MSIAPGQLKSFILNNESLGVSPEAYELFDRVIRTFKVYSDVEKCSWSVDELVRALRCTDFIGVMACDSGIAADLDAIATSISLLQKTIQRRWIVRGQRPSRASSDLLTPDLLGGIVGVQTGILSPPAQWQSQAVTRCALAVTQCPPVHTLRASGQGVSTFIDALAAEPRDSIRHLTAADAPLRWLPRVNKLSGLTSVIIEGADLEWTGESLDVFLHRLTALAHLHRLEMHGLHMRGAAPHGDAPSWRQSRRAAPLRAAQHNAQTPARDRSRGLGAAERARSQREWAPIQGCTRLRAATFTWVDLPARSLSGLARAVASSPSLQELRLACNAPTNLMCFDASTCPGLNTLEMPVDCPSDVSDLHRLPQLTHLIIRSRERTGQHAQLVVDEIAKLTHLQRLELYVPGSFWPRCNGLVSSCGTRAIDVAELALVPTMRHRAAETPEICGPYKWLIDNMGTGAARSRLQKLWIGRNALASCPQAISKHLGGLAEGAHQACPSGLHQTCT